MHWTEFMKRNKTICLNSKVNGKQPSLHNRVYDRGGIFTCVTTYPYFMSLILDADTKEMEE